MSFFGASDEARTRYLHLGKVALYQMSYTRNSKRYYSRFSPFVNYFFDFSLFSFFPHSSPLSSSLPKARILVEKPPVNPRFPHAMGTHQRECRP